jgi:CelD/BcsL family acetyltransferase involved in cellulose biosynthesis
MSMEIDFHLKTRILTHPAELHGVVGEWVDLCERCPGATPFQRPEWIVSWAETFSPDSIRVVEVRSGGTLVGLAPLLIYPRGRERVLAFMAGGVSDYLDLLVDPQCEREVVLTILEALKQLGQWTTMDLTDLPSSSVLHRTMPARLAAEHDKCSAVLLPKTRDEFLQQLSKRQRANLRQAASRIERAGGALIERATAETLPEFLEDLFRLHASRWLRDGQAGVLADEAVETFHREATPGLLAHGILRLYRLRLREKTVAVVYTLFGSATVFCYLQGYDPAFGDLSPGTHLMFSVMEDAMLAGMRKFDLLRGEEIYKRHWRAQIEPTYRIQLSRMAENGDSLVDTVAA